MFADMLRDNYLGSDDEGDDSTGESKTKYLKTQNISE